MPTRRLAGLVLLTGVVCASSASILIRLADAPTLVVAFYRLAYAAVLHAALSTFALGKYRDFDSKTLKYSLFAGFALAVHFVLWIYSLEYTTVAASTVLVSFHPIFTAVLAYFILREGFSLSKILCIIMALLGTVVIAYGDYGQPGTLLGDGLALGGALAVAVYFLIGRTVRARVPTLPYTTTVYASASLCVLLMLAMSGESLRGYSAREHLIFVALAIVPTLLGHTLFSWSLKHLDAFYVSASVLGEPVGATIMAYLVLQELPGIHQAAGGILILIGLAFLIATKHGGSGLPAMSGGD